MAETNQPKVLWDDSVHVEGTLIWFDPRRPRDFGLVTSACAPVSAKQHRQLLGDRSARLLAAVSGKRSRALITPFGRSFLFGNVRIELFPSGFMTGASQVLVTFPDQHRLVYTGPFTPTRGRTAESLEIRRCDTLVLDATYGHKRFAFPKRAEIERALVAWARQTLADNLTPVILVANPGKAQDVAHLLGQADLPMRVHRGIYAFNKAYRSLGIDLPLTRQFRGHPARGEVMLWPSHLRKSKAIRNLRRARFATLTGLGDEPGIARRLRVSTTFVWSNQADFRALIKYAKQARPSRVITVGRHATSLAGALIEVGLSAEALVDNPQLNLI